MSPYDIIMGMCLPPTRPWQVGLHSTLLDPLLAASFQHEAGQYFTRTPPPPCASTALSKHMSPCYRRFDGIF